MPSTRLAQLVLDAIAEVFYGLANLAATFAEPLLNIARRFVNLAFVPQALVVSQIADGLFRRSPTACFVRPLT